VIVETRMGFRKPLDRDSIYHQIHMAGVEINSPYNDGYTAFEVKKDLYKIKWLIEEILNDSAYLSGEDEWVEEQSKQQMWRKLKK